MRAEYSFESLADFEAALAAMAAPQFRSHSEALAPFIVPGSQHWVVYRVLDKSVVAAKGQPSAFR